MAVQPPFDLVDERGNMIPRYRPEEEDKDRHPFAPSFHNLPAIPADIHTHYAGRRHIKDLQRSFTSQIEDEALSRFLTSADCEEVDKVRLFSCKQRYASYWLNSWHTDLFSDRQAILAIRLRLGLAPFANVTYDVCPLCSAEMSDDQWHAFSCVKLRRKAVTTRHDSLLQLLCRYARSNCCIARVEPKDGASLVPDGEIHLPCETVLIDVSGTFPNAPSFRRRSANRPGSAVATRTTTKNNKYKAHSESRGARFVAFVYDSYGFVSKDALDLVNLIEKEAFHPGFGMPESSRMSRSDFLSVAACTWQAQNANIIMQWYSMIRSKLMRSHRIKDAIARLC